MFLFRRYNCFKFVILHYLVLIKLKQEIIFDKTQFHESEAYNFNGYFFDFFKH